MGRYKTVGAFADELVDAVGHAAKGKGPILKSNKAINPISNFTGAIEGVGRYIAGEGASEAIRNTFGVVKDGKVVGWNHGKIAGSFIGAAAVGRIASGGGVYKDGNGNTNLIGVPFV